MNMSICWWLTGVPASPILFFWTIIIFSQYVLFSKQLIDVVIYYFPIHDLFNITLRVPPKVARFHLSTLVEQTTAQDISNDIFKYITQFSVHLRQYDTYYHEKCVLI